MQHDDPDERLDKRTKTTIERLVRNKQSEGGQQPSAWTTLSSLPLSVSVGSRRHGPFSVVCYSREPCASVSIRDGSMVHALGFSSSIVVIRWTVLTRDIARTS